ncbi:hypothetical protein [Kutzneria sp. 744]|uniref:hypothetical protein n=1 Tax=Kutzneria sp. (strain 744) TaxID=345341 RepID=UPI0003EEA937|nr:hypothetical protein [Kutzneria sp. 744]EWM19004.1 hypothetical protein KUTG_09308 [Kutzneria sp. 744]
MTIVRITAALGLVFAMLLGGVATATAATPAAAATAPARAAAGKAAPHGTVEYTKVLAWHDDEEREKCPSTACRLAGVLKPGILVNGYCWTVGDSVTVNGVINYISNSSIQRRGHIATITKTSTALLVRPMAPRTCRAPTGCWDQPA